MINNENYMGKIIMSDAYLKDLVCRTVSRCFGVAGMKSCSFREFILSDILGRKTKGIGTLITEKNNELIVNLHICVTYGTNISAVVKSVKNKVSFALNEYAGVTVQAVNVYIDGIKN
ncbi:Asp23/Gls24 family envelope stress response protein [Porcipelethomonas ammoniilytica]|jgi:uncharacterized alkaline shock family protein YloU|uniref:Asp23/Gls24 family envelope stress response protein n=2 Tax=Oscillospiraceae TaxID=216572 RepID=UPI00082089AC|nr:Asp23/Gls24 family envelope stress response protein [Porcipelethomonas ammoniilytica]MCU6719242.1 Asp23/Gls24 family envelope stress response protein [Porcipelethomonas ammoniilytica]SCI74389.1 Protein of uncharacterised function (DUF322) [uncultured Ruminococcus sp.]